MINYFNLIRALQTDQYDEYTVKELKEEFNTEPDIDTTHVGIFPEGKLSGMPMLIGAVLHSFAQTGSVILVDNQQAPAYLAQLPNKILQIKKIDIEPLTASTVAILNPKTNKHQKQQNNYRSRNFKK